MVRTRTLWLYAVFWAVGNAVSVLVGWTDLGGGICGVTSVFFFVALVHFNGFTSRRTGST